MTEPSPAVEICGLTKRFGPVTAVEAVTLNVAAGEIFGLVGPDGAGKTTLMRMLAGIMTPSAGTAIIAGADVVTEPEEVKKRIGYLSQVFSLYTDLTISENLDFVTEIYGEDRQRAAEAKTGMLAMTGLAPFADRLAGRLSGGMKQKLGLMCALVHRPAVLLLDEPTTGVDPVSRRDFWRILADLPSQGVTVVLSSPYMDEAARCHRLALIDHGRILASGTTAEVTGQIDGVVVEVVTPSVRTALAALDGRPEIRSVTPFGDALHARVTAPDPPAAVRAALEAAGVPFAGVETIETTLEDAFIDLTARRAAP